VRILIAGGAGFVGSHLAEALLGRGDEVVVADNFATGSGRNLSHLSRFPGFRLLRRDVTRPLRLDGPLDAVLHLASPASPADYVRLAIPTLLAGSEGTRRLCDLALEKEARFLLASTSEVYGDPEVHPQPESYWGRVNPIGPRSMYDEAKRYAEALTTAYHRSRGLPVRIARIFNTYGPRMRPLDGRAVCTFIAQALSGEDLTVHGDGLQTRSFCYVDDLVRGLILLLESSETAPVNLGNPEEVTIRELAQEILRLTGSRSRRLFRPRLEDDPRQRKPDIARAMSCLRWEPRVSRAEGLRRTIDHFRGALAA
jgi:nucleoside-diphosphate-sugar epimerase